jgi:hypothetical protein
MGAESHSDEAFIDKQDDAYRVQVAFNELFREHGLKPPCIGHKEFESPAFVHGVTRPALSVTIRIAGHKRIDLGWLVILREKARTGTFFESAG